MGFQAPRIIGGGQIIQPQSQGNPFKGITDEINIQRDRELKEKALKLEALNIYGDKDYDLERGNSSEFEDFYSQLSGPQKPSFLDLAKEKVGGGYRSVADMFAKAKGNFNLNPNAKKDSEISYQADIGRENLRSKFEDDSTNTLISAANDWKSNPNDKESLIALQKLLFPDNPEEADGIMGKKTKDAMTASGIFKAQQQGGYSFGDEPTGYSLEGGGDVPGKRTGDKNPAMLEDGEYVLNRNAVKALGKGFLDHINDERYPRFQSGGFNEPDIAGGTAQLIQPPVMDNSEAFNFGGGGGGGEGGGEDKMEMASMAMKLFGMNRGGHVPKYQQGGTVKRPTGYQTGGLPADTPLNPNWSSGRQTRERNIQSSQLDDALKRKYYEEEQERKRQLNLVLKTREETQAKQLDYEKYQNEMEAHNLKAPGALQNFSRVISNLVSSEENQIPRFQRMEDINSETGEAVKWMYGEQPSTPPKMPGLLDIVKNPYPETEQYYSGLPGSRELSDMPLKSIGATRADPADVLTGLSPEQLKALWKKQLSQEGEDYSYEEYLNKWFPEQ